MTLHSDPFKIVLFLIRSKERKELTCLVFVVCAADGSCQGQVCTVQYLSASGSAQNCWKGREKEGRGDAPFADSTDRENSRTDNHSSSGTVWENIRALDCPTTLNTFSRTFAHFYHLQKELRCFCKFFNTMLKTALLTIRTVMRVKLS
jgi:hypothetical protein